MKTATLFFALIISTPAHADLLKDGSKAIGKGWDDVKREGGKGVGNVAREGKKIIQQGQTDTSNALNRIDPRLNVIPKKLDDMRREWFASVINGPTLEQWLRNSRNSSINGAMPVPWYVKEALRGWYSPELLNKVSYRIGDGGALNLANGAIRFGHAEAVTLIDVIVFKGPSEANDFALWAHEMKHAEQFDDWGVRNFAIRYMRSWNTVENPAYAVGAQYVQNRGRPPSQQASQSSQQAATNIPEFKMPQQNIPVFHAASQPSRQPQEASSANAPGFAERCVTKFGSCRVKTFITFRGQQCECSTTIAGEQVLGVAQ